MATIETITVGNTTYDIAESGYSLSDVYSTTESRIGTWTNGKPLYQKVIETTAPTVVTEGTYVTTTPSHGISNGELVFIKEAFIVDSANICRRMPYLLNNGTQVKVSAGRTSLQCISGTKQYNGAVLYVILNYTKTTD